MRSAVMILAAFGLAACGTAVPDSGAGVGFQDYDAYAAPAPVTPAPAPAAGFTPGGALAAIDKAEGKNTDTALTPTNVPLSTQAASSPYAAPTAQPYGQPQAGAVIGGADRPRGNAPAGIAETTSEMAGVAGSAANAGVSDEQDFAAVSARETIESDKARIERNRAQYQVDQPTALPQRSGSDAPNIVQYAISANHPKGTQMYKRSGLRLNSYNAACGKFPSPDLAQEAFLAAGGPDRDRKGLDPDGDGYACAWDPTPFRAAVQN